MMTKLLAIAFLILQSSFFISSQKEHRFLWRTTQRRNRRDVGSEVHAPIHPFPGLATERVLRLPDSKKGPIPLRNRSLCLAR